MNAMIDEEDWLDRQLREATPYIDDERLYRARHGKSCLQPGVQPRWLRAMIFLGLTLIGSGIAYLSPVVGGLFAKA